MGPRVGLALSGGGHRACVFALGVLLYLADAGRTGDIVSIASVSGGSLANGVLAQDLDLTTCSKQQLEHTVAGAARCVAGRGALFGAWFTWMYLAWLLLLLILVAVGTWFLPLAIGWRVLVFGAGVLVLAGTVALRGRVCARAYAATLFSPGGRRTRLAQVNAKVDHVICATELHAGEHMYFSGRFLSSYRFGLGRPGKLGLHTAVQASAAFPFVFPATWLRAARFHFNGGREQAHRARFLALHDGGVYDNMGDQWMQGLADRAARAENAGEDFQVADELIVVSASAGLGWKSALALRIPLVGGFFTLLRDKSILYDNGNSLRRQGLVSRFDLAAREERGLRGALVHIPQNPFRVAGQFAASGKEWPRRAEAAQRALALLDAGIVSREDWEEIAKADAAVHTTLLGLGAGVTARLLHHAYVQAMVNLHIILGYPLLELPSRERFTALLGSR
jgi:predicted acylesterase/phospholipase RssA